MAKTKPLELKPLFDAIVEDDLATTKAILKATPALAVTLIPTAQLFNSKILHQIYVGDSALHLAAAGHRSKIAQTLISAGADPNLPNSHRLGRPLHYASDSRQNPIFDESGQIKTLKILLAAGADVHAADKNGATALHRAVRTRGAGAVACLLEAGADPTVPNQSGATPFHLAVQNTGRGGTGSAEAQAAQRQIIQTMLKYGLSPTLKDGRGKTVLDWATSDWVRELLA